jgi:glycosyltransferase 2 family protein
VSQQELNKAPAKTQPILKRLIPGLVFGFIVLLILFLASDLRKVSLSLLHFNWMIFPLVILFTLFNYTLRFFKWHFYLNQIGVRSIPLKESARLFVAGFPLAVTPGKVGEALKGVWLNQKCGLPIGKGVSVVVAERISDGLAVLGLSTLGVIAFPQYWMAFLVVLLILLAIMIISQIRPLALWFLSIGAKLPLIKKFIGGVRDFYEGSFALFRPGATLLAVGLGMISWFGEGFGFYLILQGLGLPSGWQTLSMSVFVLSFSTVVGAASTLPGGLGAAEASIAGMLAFVLGVDGATSSAATLLIRLATLWFGVGLGLLVWFVSPHLFRVQDSDGKISEG